MKDGRRKTEGRRQEPKQGMHGNPETNNQTTNN